MPTFEVFVNGVLACTAQAEGDGSLSAILSWRGGASRGADAPLTLSVGGMRGDELVRWAMPAVQIGDEIAIRALDSAEADCPSDREMLDSARIRAEQEAHVRRMAAEWGWLIQELPSPA